MIHATASHEVSYSCPVRHASVLPRAPFSTFSKGPLFRRLVLPPAGSTEYFPPRSTLLRTLLVARSAEPGTHIKEPSFARFFYMNDSITPV